MTQVTYAVPVEAVSHGADFAGKLTLVDLVAERADLRESAVVELGPNGWVATVLYTCPGQPRHVRVAHVRLLWAPQVSPQNKEAPHA